MSASIKFFLRLSLTFNFNSLHVNVKVESESRLHYFRSRQDEIENQSKNLTERKKITQEKTL